MEALYVVCGRFPWTQFFGQCFLSFKFQTGVVSVITVKFSSDSQWDFGLEIGFIDHLQVITTNNYNTIANFHTLQISTAHTKSFESAVSSPVIIW
jgi:hypothetical protein